MDGADWSIGPWERKFETRLTRQRQATDCGVACLSMVARVTYETAHSTFSALGYETKHRPMATNFRQMEIALSEHGLISRRLRWRGWDAFLGLGVLKVPVEAKRDIQVCMHGHWHWVVAEKHPSYGIVLRDPACPLVALEKPLMNVMHQDLSRYQPFGSWITIVGQGISENSLK